MQLFDRNGDYQDFLGNTIHLHRTRPDSLREHWRLRDAVEQFSYMRLSTRSASPLTAAIASTVESP